jgi:hypothetical protein
MASFAQKVTCFLLLVLVIANGAEGEWHFCREQCRDQLAAFGYLRRIRASLLACTRSRGECQRYKHIHVLRAPDQQT